MGLQFLQQGFVSKEQQQIELNMGKDACMGNNFICRRFIINYLDFFSKEPWYSGLK